MHDVRRRRGGRGSPAWKGVLIMEIAIVAAIVAFVAVIVRRREIREDLRHEESRELRAVIEAALREQTRRDA